MSASFIENVLAGLVVALVGAITFVAYQHPAVYAAWFPKILIGEIVIGTALFIFEMGARLAHVRLIKYLRTEAYDQAETTVMNLNPAQKGWRMALWWLFAGYLWALSLLPKLLNFPA